jgi:hypothetical protein
MLSRMFLNIIDPVAIFILPNNEQLGTMYPNSSIK